LKHIYFLILIFLSVIIIPGSDYLYAQKPQQNRGFEIAPDESEQFVTNNNMRVNAESGVPVSVYQLNYKVNPDTPEKMARQFLQENSSVLHLKNNLSDLRYTGTVETPGGYHVHFTQYIGEFPVEKSTLNVTINKNNKVFFLASGYKVAYGSKNQVDIENLSVSQNDALIIAKNYLGVTQNISYEKKETVIYYNK